jgi:hypothetical protein
MLFDAFEYDFQFMPKHALSFGNSDISLYTCAMYVKFL